MNKGLRVVGKVVGVPLAILGAIHLVFLRLFRPD